MESVISYKKYKDEKELLEDIVKAMFGSGLNFWREMVRGFLAEYSEEELFPPQELASGAIFFKCPYCEEGIKLDGSLVDAYESGWKEILHEPGCVWTLARRWKIAYDDGHDIPIPKIQNKGQI
jgi:hypothetical protein